MEREVIVDKVIEIVKESIDDDSVEVNAESAKDSTENWDSMMHLMVISNIEEGFGITMTMEAMENCNSVETLTDYILKQDI